MEQNKALELEQQPIGKLLIQYATPAIIAMTAMSLYNIVDSIFIGHGVGALAISGLAITFPLANIAAAFGSLVGVGASALLSVKLGQKDYKTTQKILGNLTVMNVIMGFALSVVAILFLDDILYFFGASENTISYARDYMFIILLGNIPLHMYMGLNAIMRSAGHPKRAMQATMLSVIVNTILDALFIFVFKWGIQGAAIATVIGQIVALIWQLRILNNPKELIHFKKGTYKLDWELIKEMVMIGMSPFLMNLSSSVVIIVINKALMKHGGDLAVGAYGINNRLIFLAIMIMMGICQGMQPIVGYNYGAKLFKRVDKALKLSIYAATTVELVLFISGQTISTKMVSIFTSDPELIAISARAMRLIILACPIVGFQMVTAQFFQSVGQAHKAIFMSLSRQLLFLIPFLIIFPQFWGTDGVWLSFPVSDVMSSIAAGILLYQQFKAFKREEKNGLMTTQKI